MSRSHLDKLDKQIARVVTRVKQLENDNDKLRQKAAKLETSLQAVPSQADSGQWMEEREAIRDRVEQLAHHLESVLEEE